MSKDSNTGELGLGVVALTLFFLSVPFLLIWNLTPDWMKYPPVYAIYYNVGLGSVHVDRKPSDCEWGHAPIGDKACHYKKQVSTIDGTTAHVTDVYVRWVKVQE